MLLTFLMVTHHNKVTPVEKSRNFGYRTQKSNWNKAGSFCFPAFLVTEGAMWASWGRKAINSLTQMWVLCDIYNT